MIKLKNIIKEEVDKKELKKQVKIAGINPKDMRSQ